MAESLGINEATHHLLLCADPTKPKCCDKQLTLTAWDYLKKRLKELGLDRPGGNMPQCVLRTKANCLRICSAGPILLVYPEG
ncbi:MAG: (2Fe-2S) ferredoxin domain-containing protein, partial [Cyanobacteria bacterium P01_H01_bin.15]